MSKTKTAKKPKTDDYQAIADKLLSLMQSGTVPWRKPWHTTPYMNAVTGHQYSGINPLLAEFDILFHGYSNTFFVGFYQAKDIGWKIRKGSKATGLSLCKQVNKEQTDVETEETDTTFYIYRTWLKVFNLDCIDDSESETKIEAVIAQYSGNPNTSPRIEDAEKLIAAQNAEVSFGGNRACYSPSLDKIQIPAYESFSDSQSYYATLIHELAHRTGHASRLARNLLGTKGSSDYAFEELVADMTSAFVCGMLGIRPDLENHASYLEGWMEIVRDNNKAFFKAFKLAQAAADLLIGNAGLLASAAEDAADAA